MDNTERRKLPACASRPRGKSHPRTAAAGKRKASVVRDGLAGQRRFFPSVTGKLRVENGGWFWRIGFPESVFTSFGGGLEECPFPVHLILIRPV